MTRLSEGRRGPIRLLAGITGVIAALGTTAYAQEVTATAQPAWDSAPREVGFRKAARLRGHLDDHTPGDVVELQRAKPRGSYRSVRSRTVDDGGRVQFRLTGLRSSARYRLAHTDETGVATHSPARKVRVRPKLSFKARPSHVMRGRSIKVRGSLYPVHPGRKVKIQRRRDGAWRTVTKVKVRDGRYRTRLDSGKPGRRSLRAQWAGDAHNTRKKRRRRVRVHEPELATWYGPGFYGNRTACGQRLGYSTHGVAHRSLPCGTELSILYRGRNVKVRVIDRGPYTSAKFDLTRATADRLNFSGKNHVGVVREP